MKKKEKGKGKEVEEKETKGTGQMKVTQLKPQDLELPAVRIDSWFAEDTIEMFKDDIKKAGIETPLLIAKTDEHMWVIDGKHRLEEALLNGYKTVPCVVREMSEADMLLRNLVTNTLRGKTVPSQEVKVVHHAYDKLGLTIKEICKRTGMRQERLEMLLNIGSACTAVLDGLDQNKISVCQAYQLSRLPDTGMQIKLLHQLYVAKMTCTDLRDVINDISKMMAQVNEEAGKRATFMPPPVPTAKCNLCEQMYPPQDMLSLPICKHCWSYMQVQSDSMRQEVELEQKKREDKAKEVIDSVSESGQMPVAAK